MGRVRCTLVDIGLGMHTAVCKGLQVAGVRLVTIIVALVVAIVLVLLVAGVMGCILGCVPSAQESVQAGN